MNAFNLPSLPCLCSNIRRAGRAISQLYEVELRPLGLHTTQFTILQFLDRAGEVTQKRMGEMLAMDTTSLTRTLAIMVREGWIAERPGKDRRERWLRLSNEGEKQLKRALPAWNKVQSRLCQQLGEQSWNSLMQLNDRVANLVGKGAE